jgi:hypothetical protein
MKRVSRAASQPLEVQDGRDLSPVLWPRCPQKDRGGMPHYEYGGHGACEGDPDLHDDDHRPLSVGQLAPAGGLYPRGHGINRCVLASGL